MGDVTTMEDATSLEEMKRAYGELQAELEKSRKA
jgi:hypothetical protein